MGRVFDWLRRRSAQPDGPGVTRILFVCTGNICRSPTAEGVARARFQAAGLQARVILDSAGTQGYHAGSPPDPRTLKAAKLRGYDLSRQRARLFVAEDYLRFDLILAMDRGHLESLLAKCPPEHRPKIGLFMAYACQSSIDEVPDPYFGGPQGFERVLDLCEEGVEGLLKSVSAEI